MAEISREKEREYLKYKKYLTSLTADVCKCLRLIDMEMKTPSSVDRGKRIAQICNALEMQNDQAMYFGLRFGFRKIANIKKK